MGKHLWRKHSYVRVEKEDPGCMWAVFRILNYHRWHNVKRMLPYKKNKPEDQPSKNKGKPKQQHQIYIQEELEEEAIKMNSASVSSRNLENGLPLTTEEQNYMKLDLPQQTELPSLEDDDCDDHMSAPTLFSLLEANRKLISSGNHVEESPSNPTLETKVEHRKDSKEDQVGVLEIFRVNQDLFLKVLKDNPSKMPRLAKSGTFPAPNPSETATLGRTKSKVEHKHNEVWPVINLGHELRRIKSFKIGRSSSLNESVERYDHWFDAISNDREIRKQRSRSFKLTNEKDFALVGDHLGRRSFRERLSLLEIESRSFFSNDTPPSSLERLHLKSRGEARGLRLYSPRNLGGFDQIDAVAESPLDEKRKSSLVESGQNNHQQEEQIAAHITMAGSRETTDEPHFQENDLENAECQIPEDSLLVSLKTSTFENVEKIQGFNDQFRHFKKEVDNCNEDLQYVKYVLDLIGITAGDDDQLEAWHSVDQPLDPAMFDGIEFCCPFESKPSNNEAKKDVSTSHRKVLFDLVNEALLYIHERSYVYYPKPLSSSCHVRPMPKGKNRVVEEVWEFISEYLSWRPELDKVLNYAMAHELSESRTGWMNLQTDSEQVALYVEDMIFDELLGEILSG